jgi:hypothetical protein
MPPFLPNPTWIRQGDHNMEALKLLFSSDIGLLSVLTIGGVLVIGICMLQFFKKQAEHDARNAK